MSLNHVGLVLNIIAALLLAFESWLKVRGIRENSISVGHGHIGGFWRLLFALAWPTLVVGFAFQFAGSQ